MAVIDESHFDCPWALERLRKGGLYLWIGLGLGLLGSVLHAEPAKYIRLRNQVIVTAPAEAKPIPRFQHTADEELSGLYLIQLHERLPPFWRAQLRALRVDLVGFVPEDAFLARLDRARERDLKALSFIRWIGEYRPEFKIHSALLSRDQSGVFGKPRPVSVLVAPGSISADVLRVRRSFRTVREQSNSMLGTILEGEVASEELAVLAQSQAVLWIEPAPRMRLCDEISSKIVGGGEVPFLQPEENGAEPRPNPGWAQSSSPLLNGGTPAADPAHATLTQQLGYDGRGVSVAVVDTGLNNGDAETMHPDLLGRVDAFLYYGSLPDAADQHGHGTHVAGIIAGDAATGELDDGGALYGLGVAPKAHIVAQRVFDADGQDQLPAYETLTRDAVRAGALIGSNSWEDDVQGRYDLSAARFDALVRDADVDTPGDQPYLLVFSAGNAGPGPQTMDSPAVGKNVIAVGACQNDRFDLFLYADGREAMADLSSRGPCEDGRIKPDLVAPGTWIASLQSAAAGAANAWAAISPNYNFQGGTSQAGPHVAGAAAAFVQFYRQAHNQATPSPALVKAALINSAVPLQSQAQARSLPNSDQGWGRVTLTNLIGSTRRFEFLDQTELLTSGQSYEHHILVAGSQTPLKITLVYTDLPGLPAALPALVNDLDLEVTGPDGRVYLGNQFLNGESIADASQNDSINNVEAVHLNQPGTGDYLIRVRARRVVGDIHRRELGAPQQDFALVVSGDLAQAGQGVVVFDRPAYTAPGVIGLKLIDTDLAGQSSTELVLKSATELAGELVTLLPSGTMGVFTGSIATVTGEPRNDGRLQIHNGDSIDAAYADGSPPVWRTARARADLVPPVVQDLSVTNRFGREVISWHTDKLSTSTVVYGTNRNVQLSVTDNELCNEHQISIQNLAAGATYQFYVVSTDQAGNSSRADNGGQFYGFVASPTPTILLVNAYLPDAPIAGTREIPLSTYTIPLDQSGFTYAVWDLTEPDSRSPQLADLNAFRAVIWRLSDSYASKSSLTPAQQTTLTAYVNNGGSLLLASMEILSRLGPVPFRTNILQVQSYLTNALHGVEQCESCDEDHGVSAVTGVEHEAITWQLDSKLDYSGYHSDLLAGLNIPEDMADTFGPTAAAAPIFLDTTSGRVTGVRYPRAGRDTGGRVVFLSFPFDALPEADRSIVLRRILNFLAPDAAASATIALDRTAYSIPDLVTIEVTDPDLAGQRQVSARFYTSTLTNGVSLTLVETPRRGLFRGFVTLVAPTDALGNTRVPARPGDILRAEYSDNSITQTISADAEVDVGAPAITGTTAAGQFEEAVIRWQTSEPADSLVKFGESAFLGRTAYQADLSTAHSLTLTGLKPDRPYFYQVVSRDAAGNTSIDDNRGKLYTFRTLKPLFVPWVDSLEVVTTNWTVLSDESSDSSWTLGPPANSLQTGAHSPPNAWGSNREGAALEFAHTFLISPPLDLVGGSYATLRFWHNYDFTDDSALQVGKLLIRTNVEPEPAQEILLQEFEGSTAGWREAVYDLSRYVGRVVQIVWEYECVASDASVPQPGWFVDDISVAVTNAVPGRIEVSNNLAQATFSLVGPVLRNGQGWKTVFTNAPPGQYIITFGDVPYYQTPAPQTNVLSDGPLFLQGVYTFEDVNTNSIPDRWEEQFLGTAGAHPAETDRDDDGFSDYAEFIAGTNPADAESRLALDAPQLLANGMCHLSWTAVPGHAYRLSTSADAVSWTPYSSWLRASSTQLSYSLPVSKLGVMQFFRLEVSP